MGLRKRNGRGSAKSCPFHDLANLYEMGAAEEERLGRCESEVGAPNDDGEVAPPPAAPKPPPPRPRPRGPMGVKSCGPKDPSPPPESWEGAPTIAAEEEGANPCCCCWEKEVVVDPTAAREDEPGAPREGAEEELAAAWAAAGVLEAWRSRSS